MNKFLPLYLALLITGCTSTTSDIGVLVPQGVKFNFQEIENSTIQNQVKGSDSSPIFLFFPLGFPNLDTAVSNTLKNGGNGDILTNATITEQTQWNGLYGKLSIEIIADVVTLPPKEK